MLIEVKRRLFYLLTYLKNEHCLLFMCRESGSAKLHPQAKTPPGHMVQLALGGGTLACSSSESHEASLRLEQLPINATLTEILFNVKKNSGLDHIMCWQASH